MVTVVSFVMVDDGKRLRKEDGAPPSAPFGVLRLRPGKALVVIAGYEEERDLTAKVAEALKEIAAEKLPGDLEAEDMTVCLTGYTLEDCTFILPLSVSHTPRHKLSIRFVLA